MMTKKQRPAMIEGLEGRVLFDASQLTETIVASTLPAAISDQAVLKGTVSVQIANNSGVAQKFKGTIAIDAANVVFKTQPVGISLASGVSKIFKVGVSVGKGKLIDGTDTLFAVLADQTGAASQSPASPTLLVHVPYVTLSETEVFVKLPVSLKIGAAVTSADHVTITNSGTDPFSGLLTIALVGAPNDTVAGSTVVTSIVKKLTIAAGHHAAIGLNIRSDATLSAGTYQMISTVTQPDGTVTSSNPATAPSFTILAPITTPLFVDTINSASEMYAVDTRDTTGQHITQLDLRMSILNKGLNSLGADTFTLFTSTKPTFDSTATKVVAEPLSLNVYSLTNYPLQIDFGIPDTGPDDGTVINNYIFVQVTDTAGDVTQASYATPISFAGPAGA